MPVSFLKWDLKGTSQLQDFDQCPVFIDPALSLAFMDTAVRPSGHMKTRVQETNSHNLRPTPPTPPPPYGDQTFSKAGQRSHRNHKGAASGRWSASARGPSAHPLSGSGGFQRPWKTKWRDLRTGVPLWTCDCRRENFGPRKWRQKADGSSKR